MNFLKTICQLNLVACFLLAACLAPVSCKTVKNQESEAKSWIKIRGSYTPGLLKKATNLDPPIPNLSSKKYFHVEPQTFLRYKSQYSGKETSPPILLVVHGGPCLPMHRPWASLANTAKEYKVVYYYQRGCGQSTKPKFSFGPNFLTNKKLLDEKLGMPIHLSDIERIRKILKVEKITILGHSFGTLLASLYAAEFPERIEKMILVSPADMIEMPAENDFFQIIEDSLPKARQSDFRDYRSRSMGFFSFLGIFQKTEEYHKKIRLEFFDFYDEALKYSKNLSIPPVPNPEEVGGWMPNAIFLSLGKDHDYRDALAKVDAPVFVLYGKEDLMPIEDAIKFSKYFKNGNHYSIEKATHFAYLENPERFSSIMNTILLLDENKNKPEIERN